MAKTRPHTTEQITEFLNELKKQTDRGAALIAGAVLDEILELTILARLIEFGSERREALFDPTRPLGTLSAKIEIGYALGIYENPFRLQLGIVRDVRNAFAHRIESIQFDHPDVVKILNRTRLETMPQPLSPREHFTGLFSMLGAILYGFMEADIRIKPIRETHVAHLQAMQAKAVQLQEEARKQQGPTPGSSEGRHGANS